METKDKVQITDEREDVIELDKETATLLVAFAEYNDKFRLQQQIMKHNLSPL